jgi:hypothetical protein
MHINVITADRMSHQSVLKDRKYVCGVIGACLYQGYGIDCVWKTARAKCPLLYRNERLIEPELMETDHFAVTFMDILPK